MKRVALLIVITNWLFINALTAQNPFKEFGVDVPVITLSKGKYPEFIPNDTIHRIGTVVIDTRTGKIIELINTDSIEVTYNYRPDVASRWISPDPLAEEYWDWSPYNYTYNNPINFIDPDGREGIVVSGQPGDHKNKQHFLVNGLDRAQKLQKEYDKAGTGEKVTWFVYNNGDAENGGFTQELLDEYSAKADELGISMQVVSDADDIVDYVNNKDGDNSRSDDLVTNFVYVGHATPGDLDIGFIDHGWINMATNETLEVTDFNKEAFSKTSNANLVGGCRTAVDGDLIFERSVGEQMADKVGGVVKASNVRVYYSGGVVSDKSLVKKNKGKIVEIKGRNN